MKASRMLSIFARGMCHPVEAIVKTMVGSRTTYVGQKGSCHTVLAAVERRPVLSIWRYRNEKTLVASPGICLEKDMTNRLFTGTTGSCD